MSALHTKIIIIAAVLLALCVVIFLWGASSDTEPISCTAEAKLCPDGSAVGRTGPSCEFAPCPEVDESSNLNSFTDQETGITYAYPEALPTFYTEAVDWPPSLAIDDTAYACTQAGDPEDRAGGTEERTIHGRQYCVTTVMEGAAGSVYTQHAYAFAQDAKTYILTFSTRTVQCENYPEAQKRGCENEQNTFDIDAVVHQIVASIEAPQ